MCVSVLDVTVGRLGVGGVEKRRRYRGGGLVDPELHFVGCPRTSVASSPPLLLLNALRPFRPCRSFSDKCSLVDIVFLYVIETLDRKSHVLRDAPAPLHRHHIGIASIQLVSIALLLCSRYRTTSYSFFFSASMVFFVWRLCFGCT